MLAQRPPIESDSLIELLFPKNRLQVLKSELPEAMRLALCYVECSSMGTCEHE